MSLNKTALLPFILPLSALVVISISGCGGKSEEESRFPPADITEEVEQYYREKVSLPPDVVEGLERGTLSREEVDSRIAAGEFPNFFTFSTPEALPEDLDWEDGMNLPEIGSTRAKKGGTRFGRIQDFPRTLRIVGPDSNGSFRPYILDDTTMAFAHRHPNVTDIGEHGHHHFPGLAESWAVDSENKTVYVRIKPEARWSDGVPITVDDVFFMFFFYQSKYINAPWYNNWYERSYTSVTRYDDHTFSVTIPEAKPDMNSRVLSLRPIPRHFYKELGDDFVERYQWRFQPTSGPYVIKDENIQRGRSIRLTRNPDWWARDNKFWKNRFNYDAIHLSVVRDTEKAFQLFLKGELDGFSMNLAEYNYEKLPDDHPLVEKGYIAKYTFYNQRPRPTFGFWINQAKPLLQDRNIRVGIHHATNWQKVIDQYFRGDYIRMRTSADGYEAFTHPTLKPRGYDVEKALDYFARAGFKNRGEDGILRNDEGQRLSVTVTTGYESLQDLLLIIKEEALNAGIDMRIEVLDGTAAWKKAQEKKHDIIFSAFGVSPEMYPRYWETYHSVNAYDRPFLPDGSVNPDRELKTQTNNLVSIANPELDELIEAYRASEDAEAMMELAHAMEEILYDNASFVPGFVMPFFRWAAWRWIRYPEDGNVKIAGDSGEYFLAWIDSGIREQVEEARKEGQALPPIRKVFDQYSEQ